MAQPNLTNKKAPRVTKPNGNFWFWILLGVVFMFLAIQDSKYQVKNLKEISYSEFYKIVKDNPQTHQIINLQLTEGAENTIKGVFADKTEFRLNIPQRDEQLIKIIRENVDEFKVVPPELFWSQLFFQLIPFIIIFRVTIFS